jgi:hypothetical protein
MPAATRREKIIDCCGLSKNGRLKGESLLRRGTRRLASRRPSCRHDSHRSVYRRDFLQRSAHYVG